jgi:hypothetical protein
MSEKHLTELPWKTLVAKQGVKDIGLAKVLFAYNNVDATKEPAKALESLKEIVELAPKLKKANLTKAEVVAHLEEMVKEVKKTTPVLEARLKSATAAAEAATAQAKPAVAAKPEAAAKAAVEDEEEAKEAAALKKDLKQKTVSALAQVKARAPGDPEQQKDPKPQLQFMAYLAGKNCAVVVAQRVGSATKKLLPEIAGGAGGGQFVKGECIFEKNTHTFVLAKVPGGLAKQLATALQAETGQKYKVRVRSIDGSVTLDSDTDVNPDATALSAALKELSDRLRSLVIASKTAMAQNASLRNQVLPALNATKAALDAGDEARCRALLVALEKKLAPGAKPGQGEAGTSSGSEGLVKKRGFILTRWRRIPTELKTQTATLAKVVASDLPHEDSAGFERALERSLNELTEAMQQRIDDALDTSINQGDQRYTAVSATLRDLRGEVTSNALIAALRDNALASARGVELAYLSAFNEIEQALTA